MDDKRETEGKQKLNHTLLSNCSVVLLLLYYSKYYVVIRTVKLCTR